MLYLNDVVDALSRTFHFYVSFPTSSCVKTSPRRAAALSIGSSGPGKEARSVFLWNCGQGPHRSARRSCGQEGAEAYVFEANDDHFDRRPVHVEYRDQDWVVIANDGALKVGTQVAASAAHQLQLALKSKAGGGVDPHAGHNH